MINECDNLDAYVADGLSAETATRFTEHLDQCPSCRDALHQQRWLDNVLRSSEFANVEPAPRALRETLRASIARRRLQTRLIACSALSLSKGGLAVAAATIIVALGWTVKLNHQADGTRRDAPNLIVKHDAPPPPRATFVTNGDMIPVPLESTDDNVTIVQLYPTTEAERRMRRELALQFIYSESNGG